MTHDDADRARDLQLRIMNECYSCRFKRNVPGDAHIRCTNPDPNMTGNTHGIRSGWFDYPILFDPTWKARLCANYAENKC